MVNVVAVDEMAPKGDRASTNAVLTPITMSLIRTDTTISNLLLQLPKGSTVSYAHNLKKSLLFERRLDSTW